jgi:CRP-like cAMP-binding protein
MDIAELGTIPLFTRLRAEQQEAFAGACSELDVRAGETLVHEGDFGYALFAIKSGTATVSVQGVEVRTLGPGDVFGEIAVLSGGRRTATVVATSTMRLITVMNRDVWRLEREAPDVGAALRAAIEACLGGADKA